MGKNGPMWGPKEIKMCLYFRNDLVPVYPLLKPLCTQGTSFDTIPFCLHIVALTSSPGHVEQLILYASPL